MTLSPQKIREILAKSEAYFGQLQAHRSSPVEPALRARVYSPRKYKVRVDTRHHFDTPAGHISKTWLRRHVARTDVAAGNHAARVLAGHSKALLSQPFECRPRSSSK